MSQLPRFSFFATVALCSLSLTAFGLIGCDRADGPNQSAQTSSRASSSSNSPSVATPAAGDRAQINADEQAVRQAMKSDAAAAQPAAGAAATDPIPANQQAAAAAVKVAVATITPSKSATTMPVNNNVTGDVTFTQVDDKVLVVADISGFEPNTKHGFHIHDKADLSDPGLMSAGGHWNPDHHIHGGPTTSPVHAGDMGNLEADANGKAHLELTLSGISVGGAKNDVIGHAVIIHAKADDQSSQPAGNAGARIAGGLIQAQGGDAK